MKFDSVLVEVISMMFSIGSFVAFILINSILIKANKLNPNYTIRKSMKLFRYLFLSLALLDSLIVLDIFYHIGRIWITIVFILRGIITVTTVITYYMELPKFKERKTLKEHIQTIDNVISEFKNSTLSPELKREMLIKLQNYKENER